MIMKGAIGLYDQGEGKSRLFEQGMRSWDSIERGTNVLRRTVGIWRRSNTRLFLLVMVRGECRSYALTLGGNIIGGGGKSSSATFSGWFSKSVGYSWFIACRPCA